jgi:hypothetical protein
MQQKSSVLRKQLYEGGRSKKQQLINANSTWKSFSDPKCLQELKDQIVEFLCLTRKTEVPITWKTLKYKAWEAAKSHDMWHHFKASTSWCMHMMWSNAFSLCRKNSPCQKLPADFEEKFVAFKPNVSGLKKRNPTSHAK